MPRILIVEDEPDILALLSLNLNRAGFETIEADNGLDGLKLAQDKVPDLIVLDLMLPKMDGLEVCRQVKASDRTSQIPVLMLTARAEEVDRIVGFELGADDYVIKPFSIRELILRIKAILRRKVGEHTEKKSIWKVKGLEFDRDKMQFKVDGELVKLTSTEFKLLSELIDAQGKILSREQLLDRVWGYDFAGYARTVDTHIRRLRMKMGPYSDVIETVRGMGYKIKNG
ncbi:response regulator [Desulfovulcanus ferrireducens]|uniref:response regulator n=1 Tax=Desulfovulcanus ferrireducens TaxID=2831190 RepID=UPI00207BCF0C|nr:response regulator transcription factor [Desulfovulcanus ferrireducens]